MKRIFFSVLAVIVSLAAGYSIINIWRGISLYQINLSKENLLRATRLAPSNPDPYYRLGLFHQWELRHIDLKESAYYFRRAIERNPLEQEYWLNLAKIHQRMGEKGPSEHASENAISVFPTSYRGRWMIGNLHLQQGDLERAIADFSYILSYYPNQSTMVYDVLGKAANDPDFVLEKIVPKDPLSLRQYLSYLYETGDKDSAQKTWAKRSSFGFQPDRGETLRHIEFLIAQGELSEAFKVWKDRLREEGLSTSEDRNLITNGDFEKEKTMGGGFDWKIENVPGVDITFDSSMPFEGKRSLKLVFNGKENVDFHHLYQFVPLKPDTQYVLQANMKTQAVTTKSGLKIEVLGVGTALHQASEILIGDNEWKELIVTFRTPAQCQGGLVRIRREKTDKFDRFISGTVWLDHVRLMEKGK